MKRELSKECHNNIVNGTGIDGKLPLAILVGLPFANRIDNQEAIFLFIGWVLNCSVKRLDELLFVILSGADSRSSELGRRIG